MICVLVASSLVAGACATGGGATSEGVTGGDPSGGGTFAEASRAANTLTPEEVADGWRLLFDGQTTTGWRGYNSDVFPDAGWAVRDGMLVVGARAEDPAGPAAGDIVTTETFDSFDLRFEFRLSPVANSI